MSAGSLIYLSDGGVVGPAGLLATSQLDAMQDYGTTPLASSAQAVEDMTSERRHDFDTYAMAWVLSAARDGDQWAVDFLSQVVPSFNATVPEFPRHQR